MDKKFRGEFRVKKRLQEISEVQYFREKRVFSFFFFFVEDVQPTSRHRKHNKKST